MMRRAVLPLLWGGVWILAVSAGLMADVITDGITLRSQPMIQVLKEVLRLEDLPVDQERPGRKSLELAITHYREQKLEASLQAFREAREEMPRLAPAELMLARLLLADGEILAGRRLLEQAVVVDSLHVENYLVLGELALQEGRVADAHLHFLHAEQLLTDHPPDSRHRGPMHAGLARVAELREDWELAAEQLEAWSKRSPQDARPHQRLARIRFEQEQYEAAEAAWDAARELDSSLVSASLQLGRWHHVAQHSEQAEQRMAAALQQQPENRDVLTTLLLWRLERDEAAQAAEILERLNQNEEVSAEEKTRLQGLVALFQGDYDAAEGHFQRLTTDNPGDFAASNQLALILIEQPTGAQRRRALQLAELNARQYPRALDALATLAWVYHRLDRHAESERLFESVLSQGSLSPNAAYFVAQVLLRQKRAEEARELLQGAANATGLFVYRAACREQLKTADK